MIAGDDGWKDQAMRVIHFDSFVRIGVATALIVERLTDSQEQVEQREREPEPGHKNDPDASQHREDIAGHLRSIDLFKRRAGAERFNQIVVVHWRCSQ
jgi:hypothetical protein